ncbi:hypothetical protein V1512DRAFT_256663 [Lipomyces arxii]|uniref:uncharacterized protein n=1 Tax=Lipomyces arxii TaxID=56418 RepID=UPI0034CD4157
MNAISLLSQAILYAATSSVLLVRWIPQLQYLLLYGKTLQGPDSDSKERTLLGPLTWTVPKRWFLHFYIAGVVMASVPIVLMYLAHSGSHTSTVEWLLQLGELSDALGLKSQVPYSRAQWAAVMILVHCGRRLYECIAIEASGVSARMRLGHYVVGHVFYTIACCACWCDALDDIIDPKLESSTPVAAISIFIVASVIQHKAHRQLSSLKKYSPPPQTIIFRYVICPHYTADIVVYIACAMTCGWTPINVAVIVWTTVNLGASSEQIRAFYVKKFGLRCVSGKFHMLPFVF